MSLPEDDVRFLDEYAEQHGQRSRSAALHRAVAALRAQELAREYEEAWTSWDGSDDAALWDSVITDGLEA